MARRSAATPLAMAVGNAVLDVVLEPGFLEHVQDMSVRFKQKLAQICDTYPDVIEEVRGEGLMIGLKWQGAKSGAD